MRILALDQSTTKTGWSIWESELVEEFGLIDWNDRKLTTDERFERMCLSIQELIREKEPEIVLIEDTTMQRNPQALKLLSRLQGFIIGVCMSNSADFQIIHPSTWRSILKFPKGKREELKRYAMQYTKGELLICDAAEDESESLCIGYAYILDYLKLREK